MIDPNDRLIDQFNSIRASGVPHLFALKHLNITWNVEEKQVSGK